MASVERMEILLVKAVILLFRPPPWSFVAPSTPRNPSADAIRKRIEDDMKRW